MTAPVVFLDIDGVVTTHASIISGGSKCPDRDAMKALNVLLQRSSAEVVISSSWRIPHSLDFMRGWLCAGGAFYDRVIGATEHMRYRSEGGIAVAQASRADEIRQWLETNPRDRFVILDDEDDAAIDGHFVKTSMDGGLTAEHVAEALRILKVE